MRIIGGKYKGYTILSQKSLQIRPTSDRARESIFNILQHSLTTDKQDHVVEDSNVLDLCCGTGALGLEAISRGAKNVLFVDNCPNSSRIVRKNIEQMFPKQKKKQLTGLDFHNHLGYIPNSKHHKYFFD